MNPFVINSKRLILLHLTRRVRWSDRLCPARGVCALMRRPRICAAFLLLATLVLAGCDDNNTTIVPPTPPASITETFTGNLGPNSVRIHNLIVLNPGNVTATLTEIAEPDPDPDPDNAVIVGVDIGTLVGPFCQVVVSRVTMSRGQALTATATQAGTLCVRIYDVSAMGLPSAVDYTLTVTHF
jgi:hypothetical protein